MNLKYKNCLLAAAMSCIVVFGGTVAFFKDSDGRYNIVKFGNIKLELTETNWTDSEKKAVSGQIFLKNPVLRNNGKNDEYVFLEVLMPMEEVQLLYEGDIYSDNNNNYAIKTGGKFYAANQETINGKTVFTNSGKEIPDSENYTITEYESGTKEGSEEIQEIFRTLADSSTERITVDGKTYDFCYNSGNKNSAGWVFLETEDIRQKDSDGEKNYRKYLFGYNKKLSGTSSENKPAETVALFDKVQLKSFIDEELLGDKKQDNEHYESKAEKIKINAYGIQADNLDVELGDSFLTEKQLRNIYDIAKQKME